MSSIHRLRSSYCLFYKHYGWGEGVYRVLVGKPGGRRPLERLRRRWVDIIRMDLQEVGCGYMDWIGLDHDRDRWRRLVSAVMNLRVPWNAGNFLTSCKPASFPRRTVHHGVSKYKHNGDVTPWDISSSCSLCSITPQNKRSNFPTIFATSREIILFQIIPQRNVFVYVTGLLMLVYVVELQERREEESL